MDSFELNKVAGAVLGTLLFALGTGFVSELIYEPKPAGNRGWDLPGGSAEHGGGEKKEAEAPKEETIAVRLAHADIDKGKAGTKACQGCHNFEEGAGAKVGPDLYNVVERKKGSFPGFDYSAGMKEKGGDWTYADLDQFLTKPSAYVKGTKMAFAGISGPQDRANVIAYLHTLSKDPKPLPAVDQAGGKDEGKAGGGDKKAEGTAAAGGDAFAAKVASADPKKGEAGTKACQACHNFAEGAGPKVGPDLYGVVGRKKGSVAGFDYSAGMKAKGGEWTYDDLNQFLTKPSDYVKGTKMGFAGISDEGKRAEVVAYLRTLAKDPQPLPGADAKAGDKGSDQGAEKKDEGKKAETKTEAQPGPSPSEGDASKKPAETETSTGNVAPAQKGAGNGGSTNGTSQGADKPAEAAPAGSGTDNAQPGAPSSPNAVEPASKPDNAAEEKAKEGEAGHN